LGHKVITSPSFWVELQKKISKARETKIKMGFVKGQVKDFDVLR